MSPSTTLVLAGYVAVSAWLCWLAYKEPPMIRYPWDRRPEAREAARGEGDP